jgi:hypothetical protein
VSGVPILWRNLMLEWKPRLVGLLIAAAVLASELGLNHGWLQFLNHGW